MTFATRCKAKRPPTETELTNCSTYLYSEIQLLAPKLIVPMGNAAAKKFVDPLKISEDHGTIFWSGPWAIMPVYAMAYLSRKDSAQKELLIDLIKARNFLYG